MYTVEVDQQSVYLRIIYNLHLLIIFLYTEHTVHKEQPAQAHISLLKRFLSLFYFFNISGLYFSFFEIVVVGRSIFYTFSARKNYIEIF